MQYVSILEDDDYLMAIRDADTNQKNLFEKEAGYIAKTQEEILGISNKEDPFDIFICYKETDEWGNRTEDSALAQELYYELNLNPWSLIIISCGNPFVYAACHHF